MDNLFISLCIAGSVGLFAYAKSQINSAKKDRQFLNKRYDELYKLQNQLAQQKTLSEKRIEEYKELQKQFEESFLNGRKWLCELISKLEIAKDTRDILLFTDYRARKSADMVANIKKEKKELFKQVLFLESKLATLYEYYPKLKYCEDEILEEIITPETQELESDYDKSREYLTKEEYQQLSSEARNQLALDRFLERCSKSQVGMLYELYLGHLYERNGYKVTYFGIEKGRKDEGRDLICKKKDETLIVQAKCWSSHKTIHENTVCQLFGTMVEYKTAHPNEKVKGILHLQCALSERGKEFAAALKIKVYENFVLEKNFPLIKCNISSKGEKIYHLPFDQQYKKTKLNKPGECLVYTTKEAHDLGFRRAFRHRSNQTSK